MSDFSPDILSYIKPDKLQNIISNSPLKITVGQDNIDIYWNDLDYSNRLHKDVTNISVFKSEMIEVGISDLNNNILYSSSIIAGQPIAIYDSTRKSMWSGIASTSGSIDITDLLLSEYSHVYTLSSKPFRYNLRCYIKSPDILKISDIVPTYETGKSFHTTDSNAVKDSVILYEVRYEVTSKDTYTSNYTPIFSYGLETSFPVWRPLEKSNTSILKSVYWKKLKSVLTDANYYDKDYWTLPYSANEEYSIIGFIGVSNVFVDIFISDTLYQTLLTNEYGEFEFKYKFTKVPVNLTYQARTQDNKVFSAKSALITIQTNYIYTHLAIISSEVNSIMQDLLEIKSKTTIENCPAKYINDVYGLFAGFTRYANEDLDLYKQFVIGVYKIYNSIGYLQGLDQVRTLFTTLLPDYIDNIEYLSNASFEDVGRSGFDMVSVHSESMKIERKKYLYRVSAARVVDGAIEETDTTEIIVDNRWWETTTDFGYCVICWNACDYAQYYNIYRGIYSEEGAIDENSITKLVSVTDTFFIDTNSVVGSSEVLAPMYNATSMIKPQKIRHYNYIFMNAYKNLLKKPNYFTIIVFMKGNVYLPDYLIKRLQAILNTITPSEQFYNLIICNNVQSDAYNKLGVLINE
jgi:hypothetical protein